MHHADIAIQKLKIITFGRNARDGNRRKVYNIAQVDYSGFNERKNNNPTVLCVNQLNIRALEIPLDIPTHSNALLAVRNFNSDFSRPEKKPSCRFTARPRWSNRTFSLSRYKTDLENDQRVKVENSTQLFRNVRTCLSIQVNGIEALWFSKLFDLYQFGDTTTTIVVDLKAKDVCKLSCLVKRNQCTANLKSSNIS